MCYSCQFDSTMPSAQQTCNISHVETCDANRTYCGAQVYVQNETTYSRKACLASDFCTDTTAYCTNVTASLGYTKCNLKCCQADKCNDDFPSADGGGGSGGDHAKIGQAAFVLGVVSAMLFA